MYMVYCPFPNIQEAKKAGKTLIDESLGCCVNILKSYSSIYKLKGKITEESEYVLIAKANDENVEQLEKKLRQIHPYEIPAIVRIKIDSINKEYGEWCKALG